MRASVRATIRKSGEARLATATSILRTICSTGTTRRPGVCPHFLGNTWSSSWMAAAPAAS